MLAFILINGKKTHVHFLYGIIFFRLIFALLVNQKVSIKFHDRHQSESLPSTSQVFWMQNFDDDYHSEER
jgi:hypothetical protein